MKLLVSGYGEGKDKGLFVCEFSEAGHLTLLEQLSTTGYATHSEVVGPYWFVSMKPDGKDTGGIAIFKDGKSLTELLTPGVSYAHLCVDLPYVYAISYHEGHVTSFRFVDDKLEMISDIIHEGPVVHPHFVGLTLDKKYVYCVELGLDQIIYYSHNEGKLEHAFSIDMDKGSGPRQMLFHKDNHLAYLVTETANTAQVYQYKENEMTKLQSLSTVPNDFPGKSHLAAVKINPKGDALLVTNRGHDSISYYAINDNGLLELKERFSCGRTPRDATFVSDCFIVVAAQDSHLLQVFSLEEDGIHQVEEISVKSPVDITILAEK